MCVVCDVWVVGSGNQTPTHGHTSVIGCRMEEQDVGGRTGSRQTRKLRKS